jgi:hypothetical protein
MFQMNDFSSVSEISIVKSICYCVKEKSIAICNVHYWSANSDVAL